MVVHNTNWDPYLYKDLYKSIHVFREVYSAVQIFNVDEGSQSLDHISCRIHVICVDRHL